ncbi:YfjI family protein [Tropicimonas sp. TH_r6]|uniref:YfjI family protein n=1 Tax=Tropicimonas sp. TH_r6 TaxID=3082085 RepID=UPI002954155B|nr:YfjI family protein [Tropicimonas sp. TH_r6]MDV7145633.1 YfjI family protein [Tropicimonas sp. TH_r6]
MTEQMPHRKQPDPTVTIQYRDRYGPPSPPLDAYSDEFEGDFEPIRASEASGNTVSPFPSRTEGPRLLVREVPTGEEYPIDALGPLRSAVVAIQGMTLAPVAIPAASALSIAALAVQGLVDVETLNGTKPTSLYVLTIAKSGERKSSCDAPLMEALRLFERQQAKAWRNDNAAAGDAHALWKGKRDKILLEDKNGDKNDAKVDLAALGKEPVAPPSPERTVSEPTFEGLTRKYIEGMPALGIFSDEGGQFLGGHAMSKDNRQKSLAAFNDLWQGNAIRRTRAGDGSVTLFARRLSMHLMVQPAVARAFMTDPLTTDTGFLPRFLICEPASTIGTRLQKHVRTDSASLDEFSARLRDILDTPLPMDPEARELEPRLLRLSRDARALLAEYSDRVEEAQAQEGAFAHITGYASKAAEQAARIAGVLTAWRDLNAPEVTGDTMADAIMLSQFYLNEASRLAESAETSVGIKKAESLREWLMASWSNTDITFREILQRAPARGLRESPAAKDAIKILVEHGWLVQLPPGTEVRGARRQEAYRIVRS